MNILLSGLKKRFALVYLNVFILYLISDTKHLVNLFTVLALFRNARVALKLLRRVFDSMVPNLRHTIRAE